MTPLERHCRWLLHAYPVWYRHKRAGEMLDTLLTASPPGRDWLSFSDTRALITGACGSAAGPGCCRCCGW